ncbi:uroporphyrinogen-III synthase [Bacteroidetes bacterium endosymbiont of Geopemphigus sp.]|uniref:uroporphyrinogen-III synthase n=1 Tax=Bacteroidetes bacterium endosymbiont of Geopemphigus sp. TaxID=2047937 RepID=UPI000CD01D6F|nr:uroporphyrinogen-III synthase [Bacteroidetes bacterium endosymbiont of Geopemphigus sp.]
MRVKNILISQPSPLSESSPYIQLSKREKVKIDFRPFIEIQGISATEVRKQKIDFSHFTAVIFTSKNAVDHYFRLAEQMRFKVPDAMRYFCQSEVIAYYLQKYIVYRKRKIYIGQKDFNDLIPLIKKYSQEKFLLPSSDILKTEVPRTLENLKAQWKRAILYRTVSSDLSDLKDISYDILVFFTPSGIKSLFENFPHFKQNTTRIAAFGKSTIDLASKSGLKIDIQVPTPETPSMAMALEKYLKQNSAKSLR